MKAGQLLVQNLLCSSDKVERARIVVGGKKELDGWLGLVDSHHHVEALQQTHSITV